MGKGPSAKATGKGLGKLDLCLQQEKAKLPHNVYKNQLYMDQDLDLQSFSMKLLEENFRDTLQDIV